MRLSRIGRMLGMPAHKVTLLANVNAYRGLQVTPSVSWTSPAAGYLEGDEQGNAVFGFEPGPVLFNVNVSYRSLGVKGLDVGLGVANLLDQRQRFLQPYDGGHAPFPGPGREILGSVSYRYELD